MGTIFVDNLQPQSGTSLTLGTSGDAINLASGATAGFGKIGQVVYQTSTATMSTSSTSFVQNFSASITPSSTSNKILVVGHTGRIDTDTSGNTFSATIYRDSTNLFSSSLGVTTYKHDSANAHGNISMNILDEPSTTSSLTYYMYYLQY